MDRLHTMEVFAAVADSGSFAKAAKAMRLSPPAITRAITALEDRLGTRLFVRTTRSVRLTEAGIRFLADTQRILNEIVEAEEAATGAHTGAARQDSTSPRLSCSAECMWLRSFAIFLTSIRR